MPEYSYICAKCNESFDVIRSLSEYTDKEKCPKCKSKRSVVRNFVDFYISYRKNLSEISKLGHYAERQTETKSNDELTQLRESFVTKKIPSTKELPPGMKRMTKDEFIRGK
jgi:putative FmdB family regulatory protein